MSNKSKNLRRAKLLPRRDHTETAAEASAVTPAEPPAETPGKAIVVPTAQPFTATIDEVKAALAELRDDTTTLARDRWEQIGAAVWAATGGSEEGYVAFDAWSQPWFYYAAEAVRTRWDNCMSAPPTVGAGELFRLAEKAREAEAAQRQADNERLAELAAKPKLDYERERRAEAKRLKVRTEALDKLVEEKRREKKPKPPPPVDVDKLKQSAQHLIDSTDALDLFSKHIRPRLAGEVRNAKLLYLVATSRLFARPMNCAIKGLSAIGKSHLRSSVLAFMPPEDVIEFTTLSEKALFFLPDDLAHKVFSMAEAAGSKEQDLQDYLIREIISSGSIKHIVTVKDPNTGLMVAQTIEKKGPISFLTTTTRGKLHPEIETRILTLETDDTEKQTRRVLAKLAELDSGLGTSETDLKPWHDYQRWLATGERRVVIPYAPRLSELTRAKTVRMRRDFSQVLQAIKAHALLRREQRERDAQGRIVATLDDYAVVHGLMADRLAESSEVRLRKPVARVVEAVKALSRHGWKASARAPSSSVSGSTALRSGGGSTWRATPVTSRMSSSTRGGRGNGGRPGSRPRMTFCRASPSFGNRPPPLRNPCNSATLGHKALRMLNKAVAFSCCNGFGVAGNRWAVATAICNSFLVYFQQVNSYRCTVAAKSGGSGGDSRLPSAGRRP